MRVYRTAYETSADILRKFIERKSLVDVWAMSCPSLLKSISKELELHVPGTDVYLRTLAEKMRVDILYDTVAHLKKVELSRPIEEPDIRQKLVEVETLLDAEVKKIAAQEEVLARELESIGDGSETVERWIGVLEGAKGTGCLVLRGEGLMAVPPELFTCLRDLEIVDLGQNMLESIPPEIAELHQLKKLYLDGNRLQMLPPCIATMHEHIVLIALSHNPLDGEFFAAYVRGLDRVFAALSTGVRMLPAPKAGVELKSTRQDFSAQPV